MIAIRMSMTVVVLLLLATPLAQAQGKARSVLYPAQLVETARANAAAFGWAAEMQKQLVDRAASWLELSDEALWDAMFGPNIKRSWMVWSDGFCPACKKDVKMYTWVMDPFTQPWKVRCPHCQALFPTNDFGAFHRSGMDEQGIFQPEKADRALLFNAEHPDVNDPLHTFGVDDGEGYVDAEGHRWRFIGAYLIYGQWKKLIVDGIVSLSQAYIVTGDARYAHKAAVMLDRVADVFPLFDFHEQGFVYEVQGDRGQISTWHDACEEVREMTLAYDRIFEAARGDADALVAFLSAKAAAHKLDNPKASWDDIQRNIEDRILRDTLTNHERINTNYPRKEVALLVIKTVLDWPNNRDEVLALLDELIVNATKVDGVSGEKGMAGYTTIAPNAVSEVLVQLLRLDPDFLKTVYERHPVLHQMFRFHLDMLCLDEWYPRTGDTGTYGMKDGGYRGASFNTNPGADPSTFTFMWNLYNLTQDADFVRVLYRANGNTVDGLPHDLFGQDPAAFQANVRKVIDETGAEFQLPSVNKQAWRLAILRSGTGVNRRALWVDYDSGERHSHADGMNIGLFAKGMDLIPDFGYPPVGYGGWGAPKARWYTRTAAHCTVVVDGVDQQRVNSGATTLWADGERFHAIRVSDPAMINGERYQRFAALVDLDDENCYVIDCFRVMGGADHAKFFHSYFGKVTMDGLKPQPTEDFGHDTEMRNVVMDPAAAPGWYVDWDIEDRYQYLPEGMNLHLRYTDLTAGAQAGMAEGWIDPKLFGEGNPEWIPRVLVRRQGTTPPLDTTFVSVIEPYERKPNLRTITRLPLSASDGAMLPPSSVGIQLNRGEGRNDIFLMADRDYTDELAMPEIGFRFRGELALLTLGPAGLERAALCNAESLEAGLIKVQIKPGTEFVEIVFEATGPRVVAGPADALEPPQ